MDVIDSEWPVGRRQERRAPAGMGKMSLEEWAALPETVPRIPAVRPAPPRARWPRSMLARHATFALIALLAMFLLTLNINTPWHGSHEDNGLVFESAAINHIRFGLIFTKGQDYFDSRVNPPAFTGGVVQPQGVKSAQQFQYFRTGPVHPVLYGDHPPLLGLTVALSLLTFGYHFWAVRLVPIVFMFGALTLFYVLMTLLFDIRAARFASLVFITFPIAAYYGRDVAHEAPTLCCEMGMALCYVLWRRTGRGGWLAGVAGCVALGVAYGWPMVFFAWIVFMLDALSARRVDWRLALATAGVGTAMSGLVITQIAWAAGWSLANLDGAFFARASGTGGASGSLPGVSWVIGLLHFNFLDFGPWTWIALPAALYFVWRRFQREGLSPRMRMVALFGLGGITHILVFREGAYIHDYWQFYLIPFYAITLGWGGSELARWLAGRPWLARVRLPVASQSALLVSFAVLALVMAAPFIYHLYAGGHLLQFPGTAPVTPLITFPAPAIRLIGGRAM